MLVATPAAERLAGVMLADEPTHRDLLEETLRSADAGQLLEAGRTVCDGGRTELPPAARRPRSVDLSFCPPGQGQGQAQGATGIFHTHVTVGELSSAQHSLPDFANVWLGPVTTSVVVGAQTSEAVLSAVDPEAARRRFSRLLGVDVYSPGDVVAALEGGLIADPEGVRRRVQTGMGELVRDQTTFYGDLLERIAAAPIPHLSGAAAESSAVFTPHVDDGHPPLAVAGPSSGPTTGGSQPAVMGEFVFDADVGPDVANLRRQSRELVGVLASAVGGKRVRDVAVSAIMSTLVDEVLVTRLFE